MNILIITTVAGRLTKDAVTRQAGNTSVTGFSVAADAGFGDKKTTLFFSCSIWGKRGDSLQQYLTKGTQVTIVGAQSEREYEGKFYKELEVFEITLQGGGQQQSKPKPQEPDMDGEDIPF